jgi:hypothetical protein
MVALSYVQMPDGSELLLASWLSKNESNSKNGAWRSWKVGSRYFVVAFGLSCDCPSGRRRAAVNLGLDSFSKRFSNQDTASGHVTMS